MGIFKAYDIRGIYPSDINEDIVQRIGAAFVAFTKASTVVLGYDARLSSPALFEALARGITHAGAEAIDIGLCSTDMLYFAVAKYKYDAGIMITASHNPKQYNGLKLVKKDAAPVSAETGIMQIQKLAEQNSFPQSKKQGAMAKKQAMDDFVRHVLSFIDIKAIKPLKLVIDAGNGMAGIAAGKIFEKLPCNVMPLYFEPDGNFPNHEPNPLIEENRKDIIKKVMAEHADLGIAFDGDCDRCFFIDDKARFVPPDFITAILARKFAKPGATILYDVRSSWAVRDTAQKLGAKAIMWKVGHSLMKQKMREDAAIVFGGEVAGHYYYRNNFCSDSGFITMALMLELVSRQKLSAMMDKFSSYHVSGEINIETENSDAIINALETVYCDADALLHIDGLNIEYNDWHCNIRKSNTEPLLRLNIEAKTGELLEKMKNELMEHIRQHD